MIRDITPDGMQYIYVRQPHTLGLEHAILCAEQVVGKNDFAVILADDLMVAAKPIMTQMVEQYHRLQGSIITVQEVPWDQSNRYGIVSGSEYQPRLLTINNVVEKPSPYTALSTLAVVGRYILTNGIFDEIRNQQPGVQGEI